MTEKQEKKTQVRKKPKFLRNDWHKKIKLGSTVKKKRKWKGAKGIHNKLRLNRKGHSRRPRVGWASPTSTKGLVKSLKPIRVENTADLKNINKSQGALIANVGMRKRKEIMTEAKKMNITILNKYRVKT